MNTLEKHNNEVQDNLMKLWDEKKEKLGLGEYSDEIALHITSQNTELLKKIAKGEIERLIEETQPFKVSENMDERQAWNDAIESQITHWQQVLEDLEK